MILGRSLKHTGGRVYSEVGSGRERLRLFDQEGFPPFVGYGRIETLAILQSPSVIRLRRNIK